MVANCNKSMSAKPKVPCIHVFFWNPTCAGHADKCNGTPPAANRGFFATAFCFNPEIADVVPLTNQSINILGKKKLG